MKVTRSNLKKVFYQKGTSQYSTDLTTEGEVYYNRKKTYYSSVDQLNSCLEKEVTVKNEEVPYLGEVDTLEMGFVKYLLLL